jgi:hypothetical protein
MAPLVAGANSSPHLEGTENRCDGSELRTRADSSTLVSSPRGDFLRTTVASSKPAIVQALVFDVLCWRQLGNFGSIYHMDKRIPKSACNMITQLRS